VIGGNVLTVGRLNTVRCLTSPQIKLSTANRVAPAMLNFALFFGILTLSGFIFRTLRRALIGPVNKYFVVYDTPIGVVTIAWLLPQLYVVFGWQHLEVND
jgi:hypothetical protein